MRTDIKIGILLGIVVVLGAMAYFMLSGVQEIEKPSGPVVSIDLPSAEPEPEKVPVASRDVKKVETRDAVREVPATVVVIPKPVEVKPVVEAPAVKVTKPAVKIPEPEVKKPRYYTVQKGDSLFKVAELYYGSGAKANREVIYNANKTIISNPDVINPGWKLRIPYPEEVTE